MLGIIVDLVIEFGSLLVLSFGSALFTALGFFVEYAGVTNVLSGEPLLGTWEVYMGTWVLFVGIYLLGYKQVFSQIQENAT